MTTNLSCYYCNIYYTIGKYKTEMVTFNHKEEPVLPIGLKGRIDNVVYEVMGFVVKKERRYKYSWNEYLLFNPFHGYAFLSTYDGHWNFIWPIEDTPPPNENDFYYTFEGTRYDLYQKYSADVVYAKGEFFFDVFEITESTANREFIAPPFLYGVEKSDDSLLSFKGEYVTRREVAKAFDIDLSTLPPKQGIGYTQPTGTSFSQRSLVTVTAILIGVALIIQLFFNSTAEEKEVFQGRYSQTEMNEQKFIKTESFNLSGGEKSVEVDIWAPVSNDYFFAEFSLINEETGAEYSFAKEIEYYLGYEDGESWSEGSTYGEAFISQIPGGRYHINIYPEFGRNAHEFTIRVIRDVPSNMNFMILAIALVIVPVIFGIRKRVVEGRRWQDSNYSPYDS
ncbi:DUF4178 domain-containing protein [Pseudochryseolinea flava]|nr:DUF4178 domain-containing protein [Pseudochryseolinea flava]